MDVNLKKGRLYLPSTYKKINYYKFKEDLKNE